MKYQFNLGKAEMDILRYIAEHNPVTVREVADHIADTKGHVRTTVLNAMERLRKKGFLSRDQVGGVFEYEPSKPKKELFRNLLRDFVDTAFGGSHDPLVAYFVEGTDMTEAELRMLKKIAKKLDNQKGE